MLYRSHINFLEDREAKKFYKNLKIFRGVKDMKINDAYVHPRRIGNSIRIDIETVSDEKFLCIYREIVIHLLLGNGFKPVNDEVIKYNDLKEMRMLSMVNTESFGILEQMKSAS
jgi:hypothetical protein